MEDFSFFAAITPTAIACVFTIIGFVLSLKISAMGSSAVINLGKKFKTKGIAAMKKMPSTLRDAQVGSIAAGFEKYKASKLANKGTLKSIGAGLLSGATAPLTKAGREKGRKAYYQTLEKTPIVKRAVKPGITFEKTRQQYNVGAAKDRIKDASEQEVRMFLGRGSAVMASNDEIATDMAALTKLIEDKDFNPATDYKYIEKLKKKGIDTSAVDKALKKALPRYSADLKPEDLKKEADAIEAAMTTPAVGGDRADAENAIRIKKTIDQVERMDSKDYKDKIISGKITMLDIAGLDLAKAEYLAKNGSKKLRTDFWNLAMNPAVQADALALAIKMHAIGMAQEADTFVHSLGFIQADPRFRP